ncbi:unnamed protein product [Triticum turgidum subsp. durum]|uniref:1,3-beta-glucan synthase n=1 Tax=Triticum turgidum subsp. durum TaxID=4567 RepID=A0A9R1P952_TRITD|nr:unnamed protein product [Triticum turgidum subsp. durum]
MGPRNLSRAITMRTEGFSGEEEESELVPSSLAPIVPILRAANAIEDDNPRVAYLCRFTAFEKVHKMDPNSSGRGVRQFKTYLLHRLEKDEKETHRKLASTDAREIQRFYEQYCKKYLEGFQDRKPDEMGQYYQTASVLYDVLKTVSPPSGPDTKFDEYAEGVEKKKASFSHYNILPLNITSGPTQPVMEIPEIKAAVELLRWTQNLPMPRPDPTSVPQEIEGPVVNDLLDWLWQTFGFQKGNVENQKEHLILLLANMDMRGIDNVHQGERQIHMIHRNTIDRLMKKVFQNYISWCRYLHLESNIKIPRDESTQQPELLYIGLYLLIWGEASNVRFMPECLCYIFHHMARDLYDIISDRREGFFEPPFQREGSDDAFLQLVIQPIYNVIYNEAVMGKHGTVSHSRWRNYDDLNEYFWSKKCFKQLGWPMNQASDFFTSPTKTNNNIKICDTPGNWVVCGSSKPQTAPGANKNPKGVNLAFFNHLILCIGANPIKLIQQTQYKRINLNNLLAVRGKQLCQLGINFYDSKPWAHLHPSGFEAMVIIAWSPSGSLSAIFEPTVFRDVMTIFITAAFLNFLQATLEIVLNWKAWRSLVCSQMIRHVLKFVVAIGWLIILPVTYTSSIQNPTGLIKFFSNWIGNFQSQSIYNVAVALYMLPNIFSALFFIFLPIRRKLERSNAHIVRFLLWWTQVYFMDTQIWYAIFSTVCGGVNGAFSRLGEIRTLGMLRSRFEAIPKAFGKNLVPTHRSEPKRHGQDDLTSHMEKKFSYIWNAFISSLREEDLISNSEKDLLVVPSSVGDTSVTQWPPFLLASKIPMALDIAKSVKKRDEELLRRIKQDPYTYYAVIECYETLLDILYSLIAETSDMKVVDRIRESLEESIHNRSLVRDFRLDELHLLSDKFNKLLGLLLDIEQEGNDTVKMTQIANLLQDTMEIITQDIMKNGQGILKDENRESQLFANINLDSIKDEAWREKDDILCKLTIYEDAKGSTGQQHDVLQVNSPIDFSVSFVSSDALIVLLYDYFLLENIQLTAFLFSHQCSNSILQRGDEWKNFFERIKPKDEESRKSMLDEISRWASYRGQTARTGKVTNSTERAKLEPKDEFLKARMDEISLWASYRGQTLTRTVRGMMYYRKALEIQCSQDKNGIAKLDRRTDPSYQDGESVADMDLAIADIKFTYVVSCQVYGMQKVSKDSKEKARYLNILNLMMMYPSLRIAYIDEVEAPNKDGMTEKTYYSVLVKGVGEKYDEEIYRIKLPGKPTNIGEGKPENQNHAIIFTRGEALQVIDMNQDNYLEEAFKMRNVLEEFESDKYGKSKPTILGLREHIFTGSVSSLAWFMSNQETSFVTIGQRVLANPLKVRFHYGHPDIFDRLFHITRGGISKASKTINLSEDIFSGFNSTMRGGNITHHEYMQVGKGRDVGMNQISSFEAKVANGNGEQTLTRDIYRLGRRFDFYRMLSFYFTTVGFYFSSMVTVLTVYVFLYGRLYLVLSGLEKSILLDPRIQENIEPLQNVLASQSVFQLGLLLVLPMVMEVGLEKGFRTALGEFIIMQLQLASVFFTFQLGTKTHYYGRTILHGGAKYIPTGRGFVVYHAKFAENYRMYSRSHFVKGLELLILLVVYLAYGRSYRTSTSLYLFVTFSIWFMVASWLFAPFIFNPSCFEWQKTVDDWTDWRKWMGNRGGIGMSGEQSWEAWWRSEQAHLRKTSIRALILEILMSLRFLIYQYGIVYHLKIARHSTSILVYGLSWLVMLTVLVVLKMVSIGRQKFGTDLQLMFRILKGILFLGFVTVMAVLFAIGGLTITDVLACTLGFLPTGWCILLIGQACAPMIERTILWDSIQELGRAYDNIMGLILFLPIGFLSWFPFVSEFQTRLLFNQAFSRGLQISRILAGQKDIGEFE